MTDFIAGFERDLVDAARRRRPAVGLRRRRLRSLLLATVAFVLVGAAAAGGTLLVLRGSVIPAPAVRDIPPEQLPVPGTARLASVRAADPEPGAPPWTIRIARSRTGLLCSTVGQLVGGRFGLVGMDGRFRRLPERIVDGCGEERVNRASLIGARVFDADSRAEVRTLVNGVAGPLLRRVRVVAGGRSRDVPVAAGGVFVTAVRGYPEDIGVEVTLTFADGHRERHPFGTSPSVVADPAGGRAWRTEAFAFGAAPGEPADPRTCIRFMPAREVRNPPVSPAACGVLGDPRRRRTGYFFAVRRLTPGSGGIPIDPDGEGSWGDHPARTAVWGSAGEDVRRVEVRAPGGTVEPVIAPSRAFLAIFGPEVRPDDLLVRITLSDGRVEERRGDTNLVDERPRP